jgi:hypothetical protein
LLLIAESLDDPVIPLERIRLQLRGLEEGFAGAFDPAEDFPEFVAVQLCRSLQRALQR